MGEAWDDFPPLKGDERGGEQLGLGGNAVPYKLRMQMQPSQLLSRDVAAADVAAAVGCCCCCVATIMRLLLLSLQGSTSGMAAGAAALGAPRGSPRPPSF